MRPPVLLMRDMRPGYTLQRVLQEAKASTSSSARPKRKTSPIGEPKWDGPSSKLGCACNGQVQDSGTPKFCVLAAQHE
jgi:hypothetical protein